MELATQTHLSQLRNLLAYRLNELRADVHAAEVAQQRLSDEGEQAREVTDRKDEAQAVCAAALDASQEERDIAEMREVEAALHRLDVGIYGDCADCGAAIALQRLLAQPAAQRCAPCQAEFERRHEQRPRR